MVANFYFVLPSPSPSLPHSGSNLGMELSRNGIVHIENPTCDLCAHWRWCDLNWSVDQQSRWPAVSVWPVWPVWPASIYHHTPPSHAPNLASLLVHKSGQSAMI